MSWPELIQSHVDSILQSHQGPIGIAAHSGGGWSALCVIESIQDKDPDRKVALILLDVPAPAATINDYSYPELFGVSSENLKQVLGTDSDDPNMNYMARDPYGWTGIGWYGSQLGGIIPRQLDIPVLLVKAKVHTPQINVVTIPELISDDFGWSRFYSNLTVVECDGNHYSMLMEPSVGDWAVKMLEWLKKNLG